MYLIHSVDIKKKQGSNKTNKFTNIQKIIYPKNMIKQKQTSLQFYITK